MVEFPYELRPTQGETLAAMTVAVTEGDPLVLQAGTGSGKTVCALYAALTEAEAEDKVVLYLVRTNSQQRQVMVELRRLGAYGVALQGRRRMCLLAREREELGTTTPEELSHFCLDRKEEVHRGEAGCRFYRRLLEGDARSMRAWAREHVPTAEETVAHFGRREVCPYELNKVLAADAPVITAPYVYFFAAPLRRPLLDTLVRPLEDLILVVDEAHNLPDYCRELGSFSLTLSGVERAEKELMEFGDPEVRDGVSAFDLLEAVGRAIRDLALEYVVDEDGFLPPSALESHLLPAFTVTTAELKGMLHNLVATGETIRQARAQAGRMPRSAVLSLAWRLLRWIAPAEAATTHLALGGEEPALRAYCLDPAGVAEPVQACHASIHMSGTLTPLAEYRDALGLPADTRLRTFPSPFPPDHLRVVYREGVTTRYQDLQEDPEALDRLRAEVERLLQGCRRNTLFLFPSYQLLDGFADLARRSPVPVYRERPGMRQEALMEAVDAFRDGPAALFAVVGGRIAEGLDFPERELEVVVQVGIPYPKPTAAVRALVDYYDWKLGRGWEYGVLAPTTRRLLQGVGRLLRTPEDRGVAVILDRRAPYFKRALGPVVPVEDPLRAIEAHLEQGGGAPTRRPTAPPAGSHAPAGQ